MYRLFLVSKSSDLIELRSVDLSAIESICSKLWARIIWIVPDFFKAAAINFSSLVLARAVIISSWVAAWVV